MCTDIQVKNNCDSNLPLEYIEWTQLRLTLIFPAIRSISVSRSLSEADLTCLQGMFCRPEHPQHCVWITFVQQWPWFIEFLKLIQYRLKHPWEYHLVVRITLIALITLH